MLNNPRFCSRKRSRIIDRNAISHVNLSVPFRGIDAKTAARSNKGLSFPVHRVSFRSFPIGCPKVCRFNFYSRQSNIRYVQGCDSTQTRQLAPVHFYCLSEKRYSGIPILSVLLSTYICSLALSFSLSFVLVNLQNCHGSFLVYAFLCLSRIFLFRFL